MKSILLLLLALLCGPSLAQDDFWCAPKTSMTPSAPGSTMVFSVGLESSWAAWWCPIIRADGTPGHRAYTWGGLNSYGWTKVPAAGERIRSALDSNAQAKVEVFAAAASAANEVDRCKHKMARREACMALRTTAFDAPYPSPMSVADAMLFCGQPKDCNALPPPPEIWRVAGSGTLFIFAAGKPSRVIAGRTAPINALCNCSAPTQYASATYCPLADGPPVELTMCRKAAS